MTGRELILYILENNLEDEQVFEGTKMLGFMSEDEAAVKYHVGAGTVRAWVNMGKVEGFNINGLVYIPANIPNPLEGEEYERNH